MTTQAEELTKVLGAALDSYGDGPCIEFERQWISGRAIVALVRGIATVLENAGVPEDAPVGLVVRNRPPHAAAILGFLAGERAVAMIHSFQSQEAIARDIESLGVAAVVADRTDWTQPLVEAARRAGSAGIALSTTHLTVEAVAEIERHESYQARSLGAEPGLHLLTSGTTGPPKRIAIRMPVLSRAVLSATGGEVTGIDEPPELVYWPFGSIGVAQLLGAAYLGKSMVVLEKFTVTEWVRAIRTYRMTRATVQPAAMRMILEADIAREDLASLQFIAGGSGPLDPETRKQFEERYGIPVLGAYGATEFAGSACAWTPDLYREFGRSDKRDSVGKPLPGTTVRIVDAETGIEVSPGQQGLLQAKIPLIGADWIRTTDIASVDSDGFVTVHGRADGAINRGGFKVLPETVRRVLLTHPGVRDACVVGVSDARLGEVPFAVIERAPGAIAPTEQELQHVIADALPRHHVPVRIVTVAELPRNLSLKVNLHDVAAMYPGPPR